jgi:hypothetical protein
MRPTSKHVALTLVLMASAMILVFEWRKSRRPGTNFGVQLATNTCSCYHDSGQIVALHISSEGRLALNSDAVPNDQLAFRLGEIYGARAERVLYLFPENGAPPQRVADVISLVEHLQSEGSRDLPEPKELRAKPASLNIQIRLVTASALSAPCPKDCFNWGTQGVPVAP